MTGYEKLDNIINNSNGIITTKLLDENGIHREYLREFVNVGKLERVKQGIYITPDVWEDKMMLSQMRKEKMIYSHETALFLHELTDRDPISYSVTVPTGYNTSNLNKEGFCVHTVKKELFEIGTCSKNTIYGNQIKAYNMERTICDILRDRNNQDPAVLSDALKKFVRRKDKNLFTLMEYARLFKVERILRPYLEVLL